MLWETWLLFLAATFLFVTRLTRKWGNPNCDGGVLPPGSMGIPFIGETIQILTTSYSLDTHPFIKKRLERYGPIFKTSLAGRNVVVSADQEFNEYILQHEGRSVELWYMNVFSKVFSMEGAAKMNGVGEVHHYVRGIVLNQFGYKMMQKILPEIQTVMLSSMEKWTTQPSVDVKKVAITMMFELSATHLFGGYHFKSPPDVMSERFSKIFKGLFAFPLNVPGTAFNECIKEHQSLTKILKTILEDRIKSRNSARPGDLLDQIIEGMKSKPFMNEYAVIQLMFTSLFTSLETISVAITLVLSLISENDRVIEDLRAENEAIIRNREKTTSCISCEELKSLNFTSQVIKETLRLANVIPGTLRRAVRDIHVKGMTIPAGWAIMLVTSTVHLDQDVYTQPLEFNPWRWKEIDTHTASKNFMPFGGGFRHCAGADFSRVVLTVFLHVLVTNFRWTKIKGEVCRSPVLGFKDGLQVKFSRHDKPESTSI